MRILITSASFRDTPGKHHELIKTHAQEVAFLAGPLKHQDLLPVIGNYDGIICGDDEINSEVIAAGKEGRLKVISKYGVGLDKIDLAAASRAGIPVTNCPGVNHETVAEHVFGLLLTFCKNIHLEHAETSAGRWTRMTGRELSGKRIGILGLGRIGKEVARRAAAFNMHVSAFDKNMDRDFAALHRIDVAESVARLGADVDFLTIHLNLDGLTKGIVSREVIGKMKRGLVLVNTARGALVDLSAVIEGLRNEKLGGYLTDVLEEEPMPAHHPLLEFSNVIITPHIGSRTFESVERQGMMAVNNLLESLNH